MAVTLRDYVEYDLEKQMYIRKPSNIEDILFNTVNVGGTEGGTTSDVDVGTKISSVVYEGANHFDFNHKYLINTTAVGSGLLSGNAEDLMVYTEDVATGKDGAKLTIVTGDTDNGAVGPVEILSGNTASGTPADITIRTGDYAGTDPNTVAPHINLTAGAMNAGTRGQVRVNAGDAVTAALAVFNDEGAQIELVGPASVFLKVPALISGDYTLTLPVNDGEANQFLSTDGSGNLAWQTVDTEDKLTVTNNTGSPIAAGKVVVIGTPNAISLADYTTIGFNAEIGIVASNIPDTTSGPVYYQDGNVITFTGYTFAPHAPVYVDVAGGLTQSVGGFEEGVIYRVGFAETVTTVMLNREAIIFLG